MDSTFSITDGWTIKIVAVLLALVVVALMVVHVADSVTGPEEVQALRGLNAGRALTPQEEEALARVQHP